MPAEVWADVGVDKVADTIARLADLPADYRTWVRSTADSKNLPALSLSGLVGPGDWSAWEALVSKCERELARRAAEGESE